MDIGSITKPSATAAPSAPRVDTLVYAGAVKTELAPDAAVQQATEAVAVRFEPSEGIAARAQIDAAVRDAINRQIVIDEKTREVVVQTVDETTGEVVRQVPDEIILRMKAYVREMRERDTANEGLKVEKIA